MFVCATCTKDSPQFIERLRMEMPIEIEQVDCMSGCQHAQTVAFRAAGKVAYLFGDITEADIPDLKRFVPLYAAAHDGDFKDARPLGQLRTKALARIPGAL